MTATDESIITRHSETLRMIALPGDRLVELPPPEPLIEGMLYRNTIAALYGPPGSGKSFVAVDWTMSVASGACWRGRQVCKGAVLYVAAEGAYGLAQRRRAWLEGQGIYAVDGDVWLPRAVNLLDPQWVAALIEFVVEIQPALTVIDTVSRSMPGGDENTSRDMGTLVGAADGLRAAASTTVLLVHHTPRNGEHLRGHSSLDGAIDTAVELRKENYGFSLRCAKQKDAVPFADVKLALRPVRDSCVVGDPNGAAGYRLTESGRSMLAALQDADQGGGVSSTRWMTVSGLAPRTFHRIKKTLVKNNLVGTNGTTARPTYSLTEQGKAIVADGQ